MAREKAGRRPRAAESLGGGFCTSRRRRPLSPSRGAWGVDRRRLGPGNVGVSGPATSEVLEADQRRDARARRRATVVGTPTLHPGPTRAPDTPVPAHFHNAPRRQRPLPSPNTSPNTQTPLPNSGLSFRHSAFKPRPLQSYLLQPPESRNPFLRHSPHQPPRLTSHQKSSQSSAQGPKNEGPVRPLVPPDPTEVRPNRPRPNVLLRV